MSAEEATTTSAEETPQLPDLLPVLPLRDMVLFPFIILPLSVAREKSIQAVDRSLAENRLLMLVSQRDPAVEDPKPEDLFDVGTVASITRMLKLPDGRIRILVQGVARARVANLVQTEPFLQAKIEQLADTPLPPGPPRSGESTNGPLEVEALVRSVRQELEKAVQLGKTISPEVMVIVANLDDPGRLADLVASNLELKLADAQAVLEELDPAARLRKVADVLGREMQLLAMQQEIASHARDEMDKTQREYFLRQQLKAIQQELGEGDDLAEEIAGWRQKADEKSLPDAAREELDRQIKRLERSHPDSAEAAITRTYLDWLTGLPWGLTSEDRLDLAHARQVLDEDHYDLEKIKERILEFLAVRQLKDDAKGPILCFVGPPGVGKTSLGRSIARSLGRQFVRISLGGVRDEAEIRGHRRTYVGALPGRILQGLNSAGTGNPVFMLDEIDKLGADYRGDPSAALLEVLDEDHYDLEKIKERIVEFLAVRQLKADAKGPILCFVGPPGVGKTSLGRSIARSLGRQFVRISLGGVRDEAEIRGHRRTYVGALPGRILQGLNSAGTGNPVFMLDEIDKLGADYRGDPSAALLEVLDPEQNDSFRDHYLGIEYDLSKVMFIATANVTHSIPAPLKDRMEVISLSGYTLNEKLAIAQQFLVPRQLRDHGLSA
ncbi:MAG TPA: LON peptidase substrate-binding domain-containing protein, partial [Thermoanaerobaculia bacterium]|nr:LON peptidase substrate-binding domain-containing protein [Thermoanaerobaculia bacterium]